MTREEFIEALMAEVNPWLAARHDEICGPWIAFGSDMSRLYFLESLIQQHAGVLI